MIEQDYINVRDLSNVMHANKILRETCISNQPNIDRDEFVDVLRKLWKWEEKMFDVVQGEN